MKPRLTAVAVLLASLALAACSGPPPQATGYQKTELLIMASAVAVAALSGDGGGSKRVVGPTSAPTPTNIDRAPAYAPGSTHESYRIGDTESFYMDGCTGNCYTDDDGNSANVLELAASTYPEELSFLRRRIEGEPTAPPQDVRQAWRDGWTGQGVNMLIVDQFGSVFTTRGDEGIHGYLVVKSAREIAPGATYYALESGIGSLSYMAHRSYGVNARDATGTHIDSAATKFHVVNHSFSIVEPSPTRGAPTQEELDRAARHPAFMDLLRGNRHHDTADAVITKAAGNQRIDAGRLADVVALATHRDTAPRTLIIGALDGYARISNPQNQNEVRANARIADYSNHAGGNVEIQNRFLVEYGGRSVGLFSPASLCDTAVTDRCQNEQDLTFFDTRGTSPSDAPRVAGFAAPRVAGFAALVRDKFPNLSGAHTANILLETATTMGLACHTGTARKSPSCARNIYGQGRVDIGAALAPIGSLR